MDMKLVIFGVVLCAAIVYSQRDGVGTTTAVRASGRKHCMAVHEGWHRLNVPAPTCTPPIPNSICGYLNCRVWRPRTSKCLGCCGNSNHTINSISPWGIRKDCECCEIQRGGLVWPELICLKWTVYPDIPLILVEHDHKTGILTSNFAHTYLVVTDCDCQDCSGGEHVRDPPTDRVGEGDVFGRPEPPKTTERERAATFNEAKEKSDELRAATERRGATLVTNTERLREIE